MSFTSTSPFSPPSRSPPHRPSGQSSTNDRLTKRTTRPHHLRHLLTQIHPNSLSIKRLRGSIPRNLKPRPIHPPTPTLPWHQQHSRATRQSRKALRPAIQLVWSSATFGDYCWVGNCSPPSSGKVDGVGNAPGPTVGARPGLAGELHEQLSTVAGVQ